VLLVVLVNEVGVGFEIADQRMVLNKAKPVRPAMVGPCCSRVLG
jgi:hypothetical protein